MGAYKELAERYYEEDEADDFLQERIDSGELAGAALGIAKQFAAQGPSSLTRNQRFMFDKYVLKPYRVESCERCDETFLWSERYHSAAGVLCMNCEDEWDNL